MRVLLVLMVSSFFTTLGQTPQGRKPTLDPPANAAKCIATQTSKAPTKAINQYSTAGPDSLVKVYSNGAIDVYADQKVIDSYINYPGSYSGEFAGPLYFAFRDEDARQTTIKKIRDNRPADFQPNMTCTVLDPVSGSSIRRNQDCANGGPSRNLSFLKYVAADVTFSKHGPGNILLPPGATMPAQLLIVRSVLYLASPRCAGLDAFDKTVARSIPPEDEYIDGLEQMNSSLIAETYGGSNRDEFMRVFVDAPGHVDRTALPGYYQFNETDAPFLFRSIMGAVAKITEGRQRTK
jgi:hypothetical protein